MLAHINVSNILAVSYQYEGISFTPTICYNMIHPCKETRPRKFGNGICIILYKDLVMSGFFTHVVIKPYL